MIALTRLGLRALLLWALQTCLLGCGGPPADGGAEEPGRPALSFTDWNETTELFVELPALVVGEESPFAAHLTRLPDFLPLTAGHVTAVLRAPDGRQERFEVNEVLRAGIFRPVVRPSAAGPHELSIEVESDGIDVTHDLGTVTVYPDEAAAIAALGDEAPAPGRIVFLKEQQWTQAFGTEVATARPVRPSLPVFGHIEARPEGDVIVRAPAAGRILGDTFASLGALVERDTVLGNLAQRLDAADRTSLDLARSSAAMDVAQAERERQRLETLRGEGAIPERRLIEAQHVEAEARAALAAAERRLALFQRALRTGTGRSSGALPIRSPIAGDIVAIETAPGALVTEGDPLFRVVARGSLWLRLEVPEGDLPQLGEVLAAAFRLPGEALDREVSAADLVARSRVVDPSTHTSAVRFALSDPSIPLGTHVEARLFVEGATSLLTIPWEAVLDDGGMSVAFVQVEGEAFERRVIRLGVRDGPWVAVTSGITEGEHVVTRGALAVRLAGASGTIPTHGHTH
jgi:cobalt-zinc-cadmium efflux system membrane fusion protein